MADMLAQVGNRGVAGVEFLSPTGRQTPEDNQIYSPGTLTVTVSQQ